MPVTLVKTKWHAGNLLFLDKNGDTIITIDGASSKITFATTGAIDLVAGSIATADLADGAVTVDKVADLGNSRDYAKAANGADNLLAANANARYVLITVQVIEVFADNGGTQPAFTIGDTSNAARFLAAAELNNAALNTKITCGGIITATEPLVVTATAAVGAGTGAIRVTAIALQ